MYKTSYLLLKVTSNFRTLATVVFSIDYCSPQVESRKALGQARNCRKLVPCASHVAYSYYLHICYIAFRRALFVTNPHLHLYELTGQVYRLIHSDLAMLQAFFDLRVAKFFNMPTFRAVSVLSLHATSGLVYSIFAQGLRYYASWSSQCHHVF